MSTEHSLPGEGVLMICVFSLCFPLYCHTLYIYIYIVLGFLGFFGMLMCIEDHFLIIIFGVFFFITLYSEHDCLYDLAAKMGYIRSIRRAVSKEGRQGYGD